MNTRPKKPQTIKPSGTPSRNNYQPSFFISPSNTTNSNLTFPNFYIKEESMEELLAEGLRRESEQLSQNIQLTNTNVQQANAKPAEENVLVEVDFQKGGHIRTPSNQYQTIFLLRNCDQYQTQFSSQNIQPTNANVQQVNAEPVEERELVEVANHRRRIDRPGDELQSKFIFKKI